MLNEDGVYLLLASSLTGEMYAWLICDAEGRTQCWLKFWEIDTCS